MLSETSGSIRGAEVAANAVELNVIPIAATAAPNLNALPLRPMFLLLRP
jgi:hypothetical protein